MQDRPDAQELLKAVERFLDEEIVPNTDAARRFHARVAANVLRIVARELGSEEDQLTAEWEGLAKLLGAAGRPATRSALRGAILQRSGELCQRIRQGEADSGPYRQQVLEHLRRTVRHKLEVNDPGWLRPSQGQ